MARTIGVGKKESFWCPQCHAVFGELVRDVKGKDAIACPYCKSTFPATEIRSRTKQAMALLDQQAEEQRRRPGRHRGYRRR